MKWNRFKQRLAQAFLIFLALFFLYQIPPEAWLQAWQWLAMKLRE